MSDIDIKQYVTDKAQEGTSKRKRTRKLISGHGKDEEGLTLKQRAFAEEYIKDYNATAAAIRAGFSKRSAAQQAVYLLGLDTVSTYINELQTNLRSSRIATAEEIQEFLTSVVRGEEEEEVIIVEGRGQGFSEGVTKNKKIAAKDKVKAAELLAKRYGLLNDKIEIEQDKPFEVNIKVIE